MVICPFELLDGSTFPAYSSCHMSLNLFSWSLCMARSEDGFLQHLSIVLPQSQRHSLWQHNRSARPGQSHFHINVKTYYLKNDW